MSVYMYNVLFDFNRTDGLFEEDPEPLPINELERSKHWLRMLGNNNNWMDLGVASSLLVHGQGAANEIHIRVASQNVPANASVQVVVCFGRPVKFTHGRGSPFDKSLGHPPHTTFVRTTFMAPPAPLDTSLGGWTLNLGPINAYSNSPEVVHRYEFALGVVVRQPGPTGGESALDEVRHYGEDPEMDIGM